MSAAMEELGGAPAAPFISMWQMAALSAIATATAAGDGDGEAERPRGVQHATMQQLAQLGLVHGRVAERPRSRRFRQRGTAPTLWRMTEAGRQVLASGNPAAAAAHVAAQKMATKLRGLP
jgi:hypothetical protein